MQDISSIGRFYKNVGILLGGSLTCEELSGGYSQEVMGLVLMIISFYFPNKTYSIHP